MRDLQTARQGRNGQAEPDRVDLDNFEIEASDIAGSAITQAPVGGFTAEDLDRAIRKGKREQRMAGMTVMLLDAAKLVEPVVEMLSDKALRWASLAASVGLAAYALKQPSLERIYVLGLFCVLVPWVTRSWRK